jgi:hypothetical protein
MKHSGGGFSAKNNLQPIACVAVMQAGVSTYPTWHLKRLETLGAAPAFSGSPGVWFRERSVLDMYA